MAIDKTRRTGTPLQDLLRGARRPVEPDPVEPAESADVGATTSALVAAPPTASIPAADDARHRLAIVPSEMEHATPFAGVSTRVGRATTDAPSTGDAAYEPVAPHSMAAAGLIAPVSSGADRAGGSDAATLARRGQKARPTILIEPADHQTLRDWQAEATAEWQARVLDDSKIVRALIQAAREARVPIGTAGGEAHLRRLLVGVMRRGMAGGSG